MNYTPMSSLTVGMGYTDNTLVMGGVSTEGLTVGSYLQVGTEYMRIDNLSNTVLTVGRGVLDTVPQIHQPGARVYFLDEYAETDGTEYAIGETVFAKVLPVTPKGTLDIASAPPQTLTLIGRHSRPYPPANILINYAAYPEAIASGEDLVVGWSTRNRLTQTSVLLSTTDPSVIPEVGATVTVELWVAGGALLLTEAGINGDTHTWTTADLGTNYGELELVVYSVRGGEESWQKHHIQFTRTAP